MRERVVGVVSEWELFRKDVRTVEGEQKVVGFYDHEGTYYPLEDGEELVHIKSESSADRETFIRKDGYDIPFETWKEGK